MKAKLTSVGVLAAAIGLFSADASKANDLVWDKSADTFIAEYDAAPLGIQMNRILVAQATVAGFLWYQGGLQAERLLHGTINSDDKVLLCVIPSEGLDGIQIFDIFRRGITNNRTLGREKWQGALLSVFEQTFPCNKQ